MRGSVSNVTQPQGFRPFDLTIRIESEADLASVWARFNMSGSVLRDAAAVAARRGKHGEFCPAFLNTIESDPAGKKEVWKLLNEQLKASGIRRR